MSLRVGGFCRRGRHLLGPEDIGHAPGQDYCRPCHRASVARNRGGLSRACAVCNAPVPWNAPRGLCAICRPEIALLNALYVSLTQERRDGRQPLLASCPAGHAFTPENTEVFIARRRRVVWRRCRTCNRDAIRRAYHAAKVRAFRTLTRPDERAAGAAA